MAQRFYKYGAGYVDGSSAYDFNNPELYPRPEYGREPSITAPRPGTRDGVKRGTRARTAPRTKQSVAPTAVIGFLIASVLLVSVIMANAQLVQISAQSVKLEAQLEGYMIEQTKLKIAYESAFNLSEIEEYATTTLGMQKANADQIVYIDTSSPDKAVVVMETGGESIVDKVADFISGIGALFN